MSFGVTWVQTRLTPCAVRGHIARVRVCFNGSPNFTRCNQNMTCIRVARIEGRFQITSKKSESWVCCHTCYVSTAQATQLVGCAGETQQGGGTRGEPPHKGFSRAAGAPAGCDVTGVCLTQTRRRREWGISHCRSRSWGVGRLPARRPAAGQAESSGPS